MQRLFSMFPAGLPGIGLLLLRASVATALLLAIYGRGGDLSGWIQATAILITVVVSAGYLTPVAAATALVLHGLIWWAGLAPDSPAAAALVLLDAIALALLGPGAYSVDSYRFGRRVVLPPL